MTNKFKTLGEFNHTEMCQHDIATMANYEMRINDKRIHRHAREKAMKHLEEVADKYKVRIEDSNIKITKEL